MLDLMGMQPKSKAEVNHEVLSLWGEWNAIDTWNVLKFDNVVVERGASLKAIRAESAFSQAKTWNYIWEKTAFFENASL